MTPLKEVKLPNLMILIFCGSWPFLGNMSDQKGGRLKFLNDITTFTPAFMNQKRWRGVLSNDITAFTTAFLTEKPWRANYTTTKAFLTEKRSQGVNDITTTAFLTTKRLLLLQRGDKWYNGLSDQTTMTRVSSFCLNVQTTHYWPKIRSLKRRRKIQMGPSEKYVLFPHSGLSKVKNIKIPNI